VKAANTFTTLKLICPDMSSSSCCLDDALMSDKQYSRDVVRLCSVQRIQFDVVIEFGHIMMKSANAQTPSWY
jgi:hypothetical protein